MPISSPADWTTLQNKPNTVAGFGITDIAAAVAALPDFVQSLGSPNGYKKLPGGLIMQWCRGGAYSTGNMNTGWSLTFPITFPNICLSAQGTGFYSAQGSQNASVCQVGSWSNSGASGMFFSPNNGNGTATMYPCVIAFGY
jgi:hypothetical protein